MGDKEEKKNRSPADRTISNFKSDFNIHRHQHRLSRVFLNPGKSEIDKVER